MLEQCFILHMRAYRETSVLVEILTENHGRISLVARGVRGNKKSQLQPFILSAITAKGKSNLLSLQNIEFIEAIILEKKALLCGLYMNELLYRVLPVGDPHFNVFFMYKETLLALSKNILAPALRLFEKRLLEYLGYGLPIKLNLLNVDYYYRFDPQIGATCGTLAPDSYGTWVPGRVLKAICEEKFTIDVLPMAKIILQTALKLHFKYKTLVAKTLW